MSERPGRPPLDPADSSVSVGVKMPSHRAAELEAQAARERVSFSDWMRRVLYQALDPPVKSSLK